MNKSELANTIIPSHALTPFEMTWCTSANLSSCESADLSRLPVFWRRVTEATVPPATKRLLTSAHETCDK